MNVPIFRPPRPVVKLTARQAEILNAARREVAKAGDAVRELNQWRDDYRRRNWHGRVA